MSSVRWTTQAIEDVEGIKAFIARDSAQYADTVARRIVQSVERLEQFPESGRIVPEFNDPTLRELIWKSYRIVYRRRTQTVEILAVHHGSRPLESQSG